MPGGKAETPLVVIGIVASPGPIARNMSAAISSHRVSSG
jgi:hypothetical protein